MVSNFQAVVEMILMYVFLFWEKRSMRILLRKNLMSHRHRNRLTSLIYSLTLGSIIFLLVSATLTLTQLQTFNTISDADLYLHGKSIKGDNNHNDLTRLMFANETDPILIKYKDKIKNFAYLSNEVRDSQRGDADTCYSGHARLTNDGKDPKD